MELILNSFAISCRATLSLVTSESGPPRKSLPPPDGHGVSHVSMDAGANVSFGSLKGEEITSRVVLPADSAGDNYRIGQDRWWKGKGLSPPLVCSSCPGERWAMLERLTTSRTCGHFFHSTIFIRPCIVC